MKVDKGNTTIVMDTRDYLAKMEENLMMEGSYINLNKYPSAKIIKAVKKSFEKES